MPRTIENVTYDAVGWDIREYTEPVHTSLPGKKIEVQQSVKVDWESSAKKKQAFGRLTMEYRDKSKNLLLMRLILIGQFVFEKVQTDALHGDMIGLPDVVWNALAREVYDTARGIVLSKSKNLKAAGIPTVPDEAFSTGMAPDDYGISHN